MRYTIYFITAVLFLLVLPFAQSQAHPFTGEYVYNVQSRGGFELVAESPNAESSFVEVILDHAAQAGPGTEPGAPQYLGADTTKEGVLEWTKPEIGKHTFGYEQKMDH